MSSAERVRASRTGDRYHYLWAARRALRLLDRRSDLRVIGVEGLPDGEAIAGEEVIDVIEYYGGVDTDTCTMRHHIQLKHSSLRRDKEIVCSELKNTISKFADIYREGQTRNPGSDLRFRIVTNRPLGAAVRRALRQLAGDTDVQDTFTEGKLLHEYAGFGVDRHAETAFWGKTVIEDSAEDIDDMERLLQEELFQYLPGSGPGGDLPQLMDAVSRLATTQAKSQTLDRAALLLIFRVTEESLFPAPAKLEAVEPLVRTVDVESTSVFLRSASASHLLLTAAAGVGKSMLTSLLVRELDSVAGSVALVFDCFAGGDYRRVTAKRHSHDVALTQIANELSSRGLCSPLVPSPNASDSDYMRVFMRKLNQAAAAIAMESPDALLTVVIDAADNAVIAAQEFGGRAFVTDLFREDLPPNARIVALCRPEGADSLQLPAAVPRRTLLGFGVEDTRAHLRSQFSESSRAQARHFHELSGHNPRVQAMAMEQAGSASEAIARLEIARARPGDTLDVLLADQIERISEQGQLNMEELGRLCVALAALHPTIPVEVLAAISGVHPDAVRSFAFELGRGVQLLGDEVQFRDEPTETWFRQQFFPDLSGRREFALTLTPLAKDSPYIAAMLPQVFFEAGMIAELVELTLSDAELPQQASDLERREIALSRARYALGAALQAKRNGDAALLAVKTGTLSSGQQRRLNMYRGHSDLAGILLSRSVVESLCSGRELAVDWPGSNLHVEAALLSTVPGAEDTARSRMNSAIGNIVAIQSLDRDEQTRLGVDLRKETFVDLCMTAANLDGAEGAVKFLAGLRSARFAEDVARQVAVRLVAAGRSADLSTLVDLAKGKKRIRLTLAEVMYAHGVVPCESHRGAAEDGV